MFPISKIHCIVNARRRLFVFYRRENEVKIICNFVGKVRTQMAVEKRFWVNVKTRWRITVVTNDISIFIDFEYE